MNNQMTLTNGETQTGRISRYLLMGLMAFQGLFIIPAPFWAFINFSSLMEFTFLGAQGPRVEFNTLLIAATFLFMTMVCFCGIYLLWQNSRIGALLSIFTGIYLVYVAIVPILLLGRADYLWIDGPRGLVMIVLGALIFRQLGE